MTSGINSHEPSQPVFDKFSAVQNHQYRAHEDKQKNCLLNGDTLCQVSRLIDVTGSGDGYVVGQQLQRD
jgi:hypothetical protein